MKCDHLIAIASGGGGTPSQLYTLKLGYRFPDFVQTPEILVHDEDGAQLVVGGVPVVMEVAPCEPGDCEVDQLHPAPPGQRWVQFQSVEPIPPDGADLSRLDMYIEIIFPAESLRASHLEEGANQCKAVGLTGTLFGAWHSDDRDDRYGIPVTDFYGEMVVPDPMFSDGFEQGGLSAWSDAKTGN